MVLYTCDICSKKFKQKIDFDRHKNRKIKCLSKSIDAIETNNNKHTQYPHTHITDVISNTQETHNTHKNIMSIPYCKNCGKKFSRSDSLRRHQLFYCSSNENIKTDSNVIDLLSKMNNKIEELQHTIQELKEQTVVSSSIINNNTHNTNTNTNTNTNNSNNTINNTTNNIILTFDDLNAYKRLDKKDIQYIMDAKAEYLIQRSIEVTHCNKKYPELNNVYIPDKKMQYAVAFTGSKFETIPTEKLVKALIVSQQNNICDYLDMPDIKISETKRETFDDMSENFLKYEDSRSENNREIYKNTVSDIKILLYNNKQHGQIAENKIKTNKKKLASTKQLDISNKI